MEIATLRDRLSKHFDLTELRNLCLDLGIDHEALPAEPKSEFVRGLIAYCARRERIGELLARCRELRPQASWPDVPEAAVQEYLSTAGEGGAQDRESGGDRYSVNIGDVSDAQIAVGKNIRQVRGERADELAGLFAELEKAIRAEAPQDERKRALAMMQELAEEVEEEEPNLEKLEKIRSFLLELGGGIGDATRRLFSSEGMRSVLKLAAEAAVAATMKRLGGEI